MLTLGRAPQISRPSKRNLPIDSILNFGVHRESEIYKAAIELFKESDAGTRYVELVSWEDVTWSIFYSSGPLNKDPLTPGLIRGAYWRSLDNLRFFNIDGGPHLVERHGHLLNQLRRSA